MIVTKPSCAPCQEFLLKLFLTELWALDCHFYYIIYIKILSELNLLNHWRDFSETSHEWLLPSLVVHIVRNFCSNYFWLSYVPLIVIFLYQNLVRDSSTKPLGGFHLNFTWMIVTKPCCANCQEFLLKLFFTKLS